MKMAPEERVGNILETVERLRADIGWLHGSGFFVQGATNDELMTGLDQAAGLYAAIVEELTPLPG